MDHDFLGDTRDPMDPADWTEDQWRNLESAATRLQIMCIDRWQKQAVVNNPAWQTKLRMLIDVVSGYKVPND